MMGAEAEVGRFPHMLPVAGGADGSAVYAGIITVGGRAWALRLAVPHAGSLQDARVTMGWRLEQALGGCEAAVAQALRQGSEGGSVCGFLQELEALLRTVLRQGGRGGGGLHAAHQGPAMVSLLHNRLVEELDALGWDALEDVDAHSMTNLVLRAADAGGRTHCVRVTVPDRYPAEAPVCQTDLPARFALRWSESCGLADVLAQFTAALQQHQRLWDCLAEMEADAWVLEPRNAPFSSCVRRLALTPTTSVQVRLDAQRPFAYPECIFLGPDHATQPLQETLAAKTGAWDEQRSPLRNLRALLGVEFPRETSVAQASFQRECGICYTYELDGAAPTLVCEEARCEKPFHQACLYEWLRALPETRQSFGTMFGECPYCSTTISVKQAGGGVAAVP